MKSKPERMIVTDLRAINGRTEKCFKVVKLVNCIRFDIGQYLDAKQVEDEIQYNPDMTVTIQPKK